MGNAPLARLLLYFRINSNPNLVFLAEEVDVLSLVLYQKHIPIPYQVVSFNVIQLLQISGIKKETLFSF